MGKSMIKYHTEEDRLNAKRMLGREAYARYAARKKFQTPIDEDLKAIKQFYLNCPEGYEVDHIIPISKGGPHSLSNLQYLTANENRRKNAKLNWRP
jgi:5-methylcytosine-specific restriction endonuclease McrA